MGVDPVPVLRYHPGVGAGDHFQGQTFVRRVIALQCHPGLGRGSRPWQSHTKRMLRQLQFHPGGVAGDNTRNGFEVDGVEMLQCHPGANRGLACEGILRSAEKRGLQCYPGGFDREPGTTFGRADAGLRLIRFNPTPAWSRG